MVYYWCVAVGFALADVYRELTGKDVHLHLHLKFSGKRASVDLRGVAEYVCKRTGVDYNRFRRFFHGVKNSQRLTEEELNRFFKFSMELLIDLHRLRVTIPIKKRLREAAPPFQEPPEDAKQLQLLIKVHTTCEKLCAYPRWKTTFGKLPTEGKREEYIRRTAQKIATRYNILVIEPIIQTIKEAINKQ